MQWYYRTHLINVIAIFAIVALSGISIISRLQNQEQDKNMWLVTHTYQVIQKASFLQINTFDLGNNLREYKITHDEKYLNNVDADLQQLYVNFSLLDNMTKDNQTEQINMARLRIAIKEFDRLLRNEVKDVTAIDDPDSATKLVLDNKQIIQITDAIRESTTAILHEEKRLIESRNNIALVSAHKMNQLITFGSSLGILLLLLSLLLLNYQIKLRRQTEGSLKEMSDKLLGANKQLQNSNQLLEEFAYSVSHDLQEPLRMVTGFVDLLQRRYQSKLDEKADHYIGRIVNGVQRMQHLIEDMLMYSRINTQEKNLKPVNMAESLEWALENLTKAIEDVGAKVTFDTLPTVKGNPTQLGQLLQNLIGNAIHYRKKEEKLTIDIGVEDQPNHWLFSIKDNGIGIAPEHQKRVFKLFQRLHQQEVEEKEGTGIGLALCKRIVQNHDGEIWIESEAGQGCTFHFSLPKYQAGENND